MPSFGFQKLSTDDGQSINISIYKPPEGISSIWNWFKRKGKNEDIPKSVFNNKDKLRIKLNAEDLNTLKLNGIDLQKLRSACKTNNKKSTNRNNNPFCTQQISPKDNNFINNITVTRRVHTSKNHGKIVMSTSTISVKSKRSYTNTNIKYIDSVKSQRSAVNSTASSKASYKVGVKSNTNICPQGRPIYKSVLLKSVPTKVLKSNTQQKVFIPIYLGKKKSENLFKSLNNPAEKQEYLTDSKENENSEVLPMLLTKIKSMEEQLSDIETTTKKLNEVMSQRNFLKKGKALLDLDGLRKNETSKVLSKSTASHKIYPKHCPKKLKIKKNRKIRDKSFARHTSVESIKEDREHLVKNPVFFNPKLLDISSGVSSIGCKIIPGNTTLFPSQNKPFEIPNNFCSPKSNNSDIGYEAILKLLKTLADNNPATVVPITSTSLSGRSKDSEKQSASEEVAEDTLEEASEEIPQEVQLKSKPIFDWKYKAHSDEINKPYKGNYSPRAQESSSDSRTNTADEVKTPCKHSSRINKNESDSLTNIPYEIKNTTCKDSSRIKTNISDSVKNTTYEINTTCIDSSKVKKNLLVPHTETLLDACPMQNSEEEKPTSTPYLIQSQNHNNGSTTMSATTSSGLISVPAVNIETSYGSPKNVEVKVENSDKPNNIPEEYIDKKVISTKSKYKKEENTKLNSNHDLEEKAESYQDAEVSKNTAEGDLKAKHLRESSKSEFEDTVSDLIVKKALSNSSEELFIPVKRSMKVQSLDRIKNASKHSYDITRNENEAAQFFNHPEDLVTQFTNNPTKTKEPKICITILVEDKLQEEVNMKSNICNDPKKSNNVTLDYKLKPKSFTFLNNRGPQGDNIFNNEKEHTTPNNRFPILDCSDNFKMKENIDIKLLEDTPVFHCKTDNQFQANKKADILKSNGDSNNENKQVECEPFILIGTYINHEQRKVYDEFINSKCKLGDNNNMDSLRSLTETHSQIRKSFTSLKNDTKCPHSREDSSCNVTNLNKQEKSYSKNLEYNSSTFKKESLEIKSSQSDDIVSKNSLPQKKPLLIYSDNNMLKRYQAPNSIKKLNNVEKKRNFFKLIEIKKETENLSNNQISQESKKRACRFGLTLYQEPIIEESEEDSSSQCVNFSDQQSEKGDNIEVQATETTKILENSKLEKEILIQPENEENTVPIENSCRLFDDNKLNFSSVSVQTDWSLFTEDRVDSQILKLSESNVKKSVSSQTEVKTESRGMMTENPESSPVPSESCINKSDLNKLVIASTDDNEGEPEKLVTKKQRTIAIKLKESNITEVKMSDLMISVVRESSSGIVKSISTDKLASADINNQNHLKVKEIQNQVFHSAADNEIREKDTLNLQNSRYRIESINRTENTEIFHHCTAQCLYVHPEENDVFEHESNYRSEDTKTLLKHINSAFTKACKINTNLISSFNKSENTPTPISRITTIVDVNSSKNSNSFYRVICDPNKEEKTAANSDSQGEGEAATKSKTKFPSLEKLIYPPSDDGTKLEVKARECQIHSSEALESAICVKKRCVNNRQITTAKLNSTPYPRNIKSNTISLQNLNSKKDHIVNHMNNIDRDRGGNSIFDLTQSSYPHLATKKTHNES